MSKVIRKDPLGEVTEHFVYMYLDERGKARYVGYGSQADRATSDKHNPCLMKFRAKHQYSLQIAGPYGSEMVGRAVETALISAVKPECNENLGESRWRFRPLGVPLAYAERLVQPELLLQDLIAAQGNRPTPALLVVVTDEDFDDRPGYNIWAPPTDAQIRDRVEKWWQLQKCLAEWAASPDGSPGLLLGIHGRPGAQFVIASMLIDRKGWATAERTNGGKIRIPLLDSRNLDAHGLRGRRISRSADIAFGNRTWQFFKIVGRDGVARGGCGSIRRRLG